ncbi:PAS domain S-box protein, partial [bacterium]|nr:PAS domain S-box protein [bacterium]
MAVLALGVSVVAMLDRLEGDRFRLAYRRHIEFEADHLAANLKAEIGGALRRAGQLNTLLGLDRRWMEIGSSLKPALALMFEEHPAVVSAGLETAAGYVSLVGAAHPWEGTIPRGSEGGTPALQVLPGISNGNLLLARYPVAGSEPAAWLTVIIDPRRAWEKGLSDTSGAPLFASLLLSGEPISPVLPHSETVDRRIAIPGGVLMLSVSPTHAWPRAVADAWIPRLGGALLAFALAWLTWLTLRDPQRLRERIALATSALADSEARHRSLVDNSPLGIYRATPSGRITMANPTLVDMLGHSSLQNLLESHLRDEAFHPCPSRAESKSAIERDGEVRGVETAWKRTDGKILHLRENARAIYDKEGRLAFVEGTVEDISDVVRAAEESTAQRRQREAVFTTITEGLLILDDDTRIVEANPSALGLLGVEAKALLGTLAAEHLPALNGKWSALLDGGDADIEMEVSRLDGTILTIACSAVADMLPGLHLLAFRDISAQRQAEALATRLSEALRQTGEIVYITNLDGDIEYANPAFVEATGFSVEEAIGRSSAILRSDGEGDETIKDLWTTISAGGIWRGTLINRRKGGGSYHHAQTISPIRDDQGSITHFISVGQDVTEDAARRTALVKAKADLEERVAERTEALEIALAAAEEASQAKSTFLANMSHELRTPLNAILGFASVLRKGAYGDLNEAQEGYLQDILSSGDHMLCLVDDLLSLQRIEGAGNALEVVALFPGTAVEEALRMVGPLASAKGHDLTSAV